MSTSAGREGSSYGVGVGGGGAGGKFQKRILRKTRNTPYDRPPTIINNSGTNSSNGWLSKLVDPASKLITASAHRLFGSVFRKRLPPPPPPPAPLQPRQLVSEAKQDSLEKLYQTSPNEIISSVNRPGLQHQSTNDCVNPCSQSDNSGFVELEQILKKNTFSRSEINHLTSLLHSRTPGMPTPHVENRSDSNWAIVAHDREVEPAKTPLLENGIQSLKSHGISSTPIPNSRFVEEDVASPSELAKAYMGSRSSKVSPSMLGLRNQAFKEESPLPNNMPFTPKPPSMSAFTKVGALENGYMTPRSRGRSAIYSMARTPYSRIPSAYLQKDSVHKFDAFGGTSSSTLGRLEGSRLCSSKQVGGNYASDNDIGSIGPIRRLRQKANLLSAKSLSLPVSGSPLSGAHTLSILPQQGNGIFPTTSFGSIPSQSSETAHKILQQLDKLVPSKDKSSELKLAIARKESPANLTADMLNGKALKSLEDINFSRFPNDQDNRFDISSKVSLPENSGTSRKQDKIEENGSVRGMDQINRSAHAVNVVEAFVPKKDSAPIFNSADSAVTNPADYSRPQKKRAFQMSAHEEFMDQDNDGDTKGIATDSLAEEREKLDTGLIGTKSVGDALKVESPPVTSPGKSLLSSISNQNVDAETLDGTALTKKSSGFSFMVLPATSMPIQPASPSFGMNTEINILPKEPHCAPPVFNFSSDNVDKAPLIEHSSASIFGTFQDTIPGASSRSIIESSSSSVFVAGHAANANDRVPKSDNADKTTESDKADKSTVSDKADQSTLKAGAMLKKTETALPSVTSTSSTSVFSFGSPANNLSANNGLHSSSSSTVSSPAPVTFQNISTLKFPNNSAVFNSTSTAASIVPAFTITSVSSTPVTTTTSPSSPVAAISSFGSPLPPISSVTSDVKSTDLLDKNKQESPFGNLNSSPFGATFPSIASTGSSLFGFSSPAAATTTDGSLASTPLVGTGSANFTNSIPVQIGSSTSFPTFGFGGTAPVASNSSLFGSSTASSTAKLFSSGVSFGLGSTSASSEANTISSSSAPTSSIFGSTSTSTIPATGFSFGGTSVSITASNNKPTGSLFSFTLPAANTSSSTSLTSSQPVFGNPNPAFTFGSGNNDQMSMEDTMAEDTQASSVPSVPNFGQSSITPSPSSGFVFGSTANPFQFGGQQNSAVPFGGQQNPTVPFGGQQNPAATVQNPFQFGNQPITASPANQSPFQASGSVDFNGGGGSFSLGSGGGDKASRRIFKVKRSARKK